MKQDEYSTANQLWNDEPILEQCGSYTDER